jgi:hypothetical protein
MVKRGIAMAGALLISMISPAAQPKSPLESLPRFSIEDLHARLVLANRTSSKAFEDLLERHGGAIIEGTVGELAPSLDGAYYVWLRHRVHGELVGRLMIPAGSAKSVIRLSADQQAILACDGPYRSYALVLATCIIP